MTFWSSLKCASIVSAARIMAGAPARPISQSKWKVPRWPHLETVVEHGERWLTDEDRFNECAGVEADNDIAVWSE